MTTATIQSDPRHVPEQDTEAYATLLRSAALGYAVRGYPVFPLAPFSKKPLRGSRGCLDATTDPDVIDAWWRENSRWRRSGYRVNPYNIGIATGNGLAVVDVDDPNASRPTGSHVLTPRGGYHVYVAATTKSTNWRKNVDVKSTGGYVVAPPSVIAQTSVVGDRDPRLSSTVTEFLAYVWIGTPLELATAPETFVASVASAHRATRSYTQRVALDDAEVTGFSEGERHDGLYRLACQLWARGRDADDVYATVYSAWERSDGSGRYPRSEVDRLIRDARRFVETSDQQQQPDWRPR